MMAGSSDWQSSLSNLLPDIKLIVEQSDADSVSPQSVRRDLKAMYAGLDVKKNKEAIDAMTRKVYDEHVGPQSATDDEDGYESDIKPMLSSSNPSVKRSHSDSPPPRHSTVKQSSLPSPKKPKVNSSSPTTDETNDEFIRRINKEIAERQARTGQNVVFKTTRRKAPAQKTYDAEGNEIIKPKSTTGFNKPHRLSQELAAICGVPILSRPQVTKHVWLYIKDRGLQNPRNGNMVIPDATFARVFGRGEISSYQMAKHLSPHLFPV